MLKKHKKKRKKQKPQVTNKQIDMMLDQFNTLHSLIIEALLTDGGHHKQWYLEQLLEKLGFDVRQQEKRYAFERGIAP
jgi:hypothetical protein